MLDENNLPIKEPKKPTLDDIAGMAPRRRGLPSGVTGGQMLTPDHRKVDSQRLFDRNENAEATLSNDETWYGLLGKSSGRFTSEAVFGTLEGIGTLLDFEQHYNYFKGQEKEYTNWFSDAMGKANEAVTEGLPINRSLDAQTGFAPTDSTWWADNAGSLGTALSFMIPATGATKALGLAGKVLQGLAKAGKVGRTSKNAGNLAKAANSVLYGEKAANTMKGLTSAVFSRYMENTMEAHETFKRVENDMIKKGMSQTEAAKAAGESAALSFKANWANIVFDVFQYMSLTKGPSIASRASKEARKSAKSKVAGFFGNSAQEGMEEGFQFIVGEEAARAAGDKNRFFELDGLTARVADYTSDPEFKTSVTLGAVGGGLFDLVGKGGNFLSDRKSTVDADLAKTFALDNLKINMVHKIPDVAIANMAFYHAKAGKLSDLQGRFEELAEATDEELAAFGFDEARIKETRERTKEIISDIEVFGEQFDEIYSNGELSEAEKQRQMDLLFEKRTNARAKTDIDKQYAAIRAEAAKELSPEELALKEDEFLLEAMEANREAYNKAVGGKLGVDTVIGKLDEGIAEVKERIATAKEKGVKSKRTTADGKLKKMTNEKVVNETSSDDIDRNLDNMDSNEGREEFADEHKKQQIAEYVNMVHPKMSLEEINSFSNPHDPEVGDAVRKKLGEFADAGDSNVPDIDGEEDMETSIKSRYKDNNALLARDLARIANKDPEARIDDVEDLEGFLNLYHNDKTFRDAVNGVYESLKKKQKKKQADVPIPVEPEPTPKNEQPKPDNTKVRIFENGENPNVKIGSPEYEYAENEDGFYDLVRDENGMPVPSANNLLPDGTPMMTAEDFELLNDPTVQLWDQDITFKVHLTNENGETVDNVLITAHMTVAGKEYTVGMLPDTTNASSVKYRKLAGLRELIVQARMEGMNEQIVVQAAQKSIGKFNTIPGQHNNPESVFDENEEFFLAVAVEQDNGGVKFKFNNGEIGSNTYNEHGAWQEGETAIFIKTADGIFRPVRAFVSTLRTDPEKFDTVRQIVNEFVEGEDTVKTLTNQLRKHVSIKITDYKNNGKFVVEFMKGRNRKITTKEFGQAELIEWLGDKIISIKKEDINSGDFNSTAFNRGWIKTDLQRGPKSLGAQLNIDLETIPSVEPAKKAEGSKASPEVPVTNTVKPTKPYDQMTTEELTSVRKSLREKLVAAREAEARGENVLGGSAAIEEDYNDVVEYMEALESNTAKEPEQTQVDATANMFGSVDPNAEKANNRKRARTEFDKDYEVWERATEEAWFKVNFPGVPMKVLADMKTVSAGGPELWGLFRNGAVYIAQDAKKGTLYHEAFHVLFHGMLTGEERANIIALGRTKARGSEAIEEHWADKFMDYMLSEGHTAHTLPEKVSNFFKRLYHMIQIFSERTGLKGPATMADYFYRASTGLYKTRQVTFTKDVTRFRTVDDYGTLGPRLETFAIKTINSHLRHGIIDRYRDALELPATMGTKDVIAEVLKKGKDEKNPLFTIQGMYQGVHYVLGESKKNWETMPDEDLMKEGETAEDFAVRKEKAISYLEKIIESLAEVKDGKYEFKPLMIKASRELANYGIKLDYSLGYASDTDNQLSEETEFELDENQDAVENWMVKNSFLSAKEDFSQKAKELFAEVPMEFEDPAGFTIYENAAFVYNKMALHLADSVSTDDMRSKIAKLVAMYPSYRVIAERLTGDPDLTSEFWINMGQRHHVPFIMQHMNRKNTTSTFASNRQSVAKDIVNNWQTSFYLSNIYNSTNKEVNTKGIQDHIDTINELIGPSKYKNRTGTDGNLKAEDVNKVKKVLKGIGLIISDGDVERLFGSSDASVDPEYRRKGGIKRFVDEFVNAKGTGLMTVLNTLNKGKDPFLGAGIEQIKGVKAIADVIAEALPNVYQPSFTNGKKKKIYTVVRSRFMFRMMNKLTHPDKKTREEFLNARLEDPFYQDSEFLRDFQNPDTIVNTHFAIFDTFRKGGHNAIEYSEMSKDMLEAVKINAWFNQQPDEKNNGNWGYYMMPVLSDSTSAAFLNYRKEKDISKIKSKIFSIALQEMQRIQWLQARIEPVQAEYDAWVADNSQPFPEELTDIPYAMLINGLKFQMFPALNEVGEGVEFDENLVREGVEAIYQQEYDAMFADNVFTKNEKGEIESPLEIVDERFLGNFNENIEAYIYNQMYMNMQTLITFGGDLAYYKPAKEINEVTNESEYTGTVDMTDVYKRIKQIWSPGDSLNIDTQNTYTVKNGSNSEEVRIPHNYYTAFVKGKDVVSNHITRLEEMFGKDSPIIKDYKRMDTTDAATFIDIHRLREIYMGTARWTDAHQEVYNAVMNGRPLPNSAAIVLQPLKPFMFNHRIDKANGVARVIPTQLKNAEMLLTPDMAIGNPDMQEILEKMGYTFTPDGKWSFDKNDRIADSVMFTTSVKVGERNSVENISDITDANVQELSNADYRIQMSTPEHHKDTDILFGTQIRKLIMDGVHPEGMYTIPGRKEPISGLDLQSLYEEIITRNVEEGFAKVRDMFKNEDESTNHVKLIDALRREVIEKEMGDDMLEALQWLDKDKGQTVLPLWHPHILYQVESIMNSFFKNNVTKQRINGASLYNATSYGWSPERKPKIVFNEDGSGGIDHFEVIMPSQSRKIVEMYADSKGIIDIKKMEKEAPELLDGIFYRIPTEHKYSMFNIKVIEFLPDHAGGQIIMPDEITTVAGLDFDIDKVFGMLYNFMATPKEELESAEKDFQERISSEKFLNRVSKKGYDDLAERKRFAKERGIIWDNKKSFFREKSKLQKIPASMDTKKSRDNYLLDLMRGVLMNPLTAPSALRPGNFNSIKGMKKSVVNMDSSLEGSDLSPMRPSTGREVFIRNMTGNGLIGIFANHNVNHAMMTQGNFGFTSPIELNGRSLSSLSEVMTTELDGTPKTITDNIAEFLAAVVDNAKEPLASFLNIALQNADVVATMLRVGYDIPTVMMFMSHPALKKLSLEVSRSTNKSKEAVIMMAEQLITEIAESAAVSTGSAVELTLAETGEVYKDGSKKYKGSLADGVSRTGTKEEQAEIAISVLNTFINVKSQSDALSKTMAAMRFDTVGNAAGPRIADTDFKQELWKSALKQDNDASQNQSKEPKTIFGFEAFMSSGRYLKTFYDYGIREASALIKDVAQLPYDNINFTELQQMMMEVKGGDTLNADEIQGIRQHLMTAYAAGYSTYSSSEMERVIKELPEKIVKYREDNPDGYFSELLDHFVIKPPENGNPFPLLTFDRSGVDKVQQQEIRNVWKRMMHSEEEVERKIAEDLAKYSFFMTGYTFNYNAFSDLVPVRYIAELKEEGQMNYIDYLNKMFTSPLHRNLPLIAEQILRNTFRRSSLVQMIDDVEGKTFEQPLVWDENGAKHIAVDVISRKLFNGSAKDVAPLKYLKMPMNVNGGTEMVLFRLTGKTVQPTLPQEAIEQSGTTPKINTHFVYEAIDGMGINNQFIEYNFEATVNPIGFVPSFFSTERTIKSEEKRAEVEKANRIPTDPSELRAAFLEIIPQIPGQDQNEVFRIITDLDTHLRKRLAKLAQVENDLDAKDMLAAWSTAVNQTQEPTLEQPIPVKEEEESIFGEPNHAIEKPTKETPKKVTEPVVATPVEITQETPKTVSTHTFDSGFTIELPFTLNEQQRDALQQMEKFVGDKNAREMTLSGFAGTGKTTLMSIFDKFLHRKYIYPFYSAPTHRANAITKLNNPTASVLTLHSLFGLGINIKLEGDDYDLKNVDFKKNNGTKIGYGDTLIIDESSMVTDNLYDFIQSAIKQLNLKVIYVGDKGQLAPVQSRKPGEQIVSKVFTNADVKQVQLTKVERTGENAILEEATNIRNNRPLSYQTKLKDGIGVEYMSARASLYELMDNEFTHQMNSDNKLHVRILSGTNAGVNAVNTEIRKILYGDKAQQQLVEGEILMGYNNFDVDYKTKEPKIMNSGDYVVKSVREGVKDVTAVGEVFKGYHVTMQNILNPDANPINVFIVDKGEDGAKIEKFTKKYSDLNIEGAKMMRIGNRQKAAQLFQAAKTLLSQIAFMHDLVASTGNQKAKKTLDYGYAHTIHKSQGGTYTKTIVLGKTIDAFRDIKIRKQLEYVAMTRATDYVAWYTNRSQQAPSIDEYNGERNYEAAADIRETEAEETAKECKVPGGTAGAKKTGQSFGKK